MSPAPHSPILGKKSRLKQNDQISIVLGIKLADYANDLYGLNIMRAKTTILILHSRSGPAQRNGNISIWENHFSKSP